MSHRSDVVEHETAADAARRAARGLRHLVERLHLPHDAALTAATLERCFAGADVDVAHHAVRTYGFAVALMRDLAVPLDQVDTNLLFAACVLHDVGLSDSREPAGEQRFEVAGADAATALLSDLGYGREERTEVWRAIALHTSAGIAERMEPLVRLTRAGVRADFGAHADQVNASFAAALFRHFPRRNFSRSLAERVRAHVAADARRGPRYSFPGELHRELATGVSQSEMERDTLASAWDRADAPDLAREGR